MTISLLFAMALAGMDRVHACTAEGLHNVTAIVWADASLTSNTLIPAQRVTNDIFCQIGIHIVWERARHGDWARTTSERRAGVAIEVRLKSTAFLGGRVLPCASEDALGCAIPDAKLGGSVYVYYDRVLELAGGPNRKMAAILLGHVFAHEIAHVLEGQARHSPTALMKAHWDEHDYAAMAVRPLPLDPQDIELIEKRLSARSSGPEWARKARCPK